MAEKRKVLGQLAPSATTNTNLYTVPGGTEVVSSSITFCNRNTSAVGSVSCWVRVLGAVVENKQMLLSASPVPASDTLILTIGATLDATDIITVWCSSADFSINMFGIEVS